jgi:hypothetical protein
VLGTVKRGKAIGEDKTLTLWTGLQILPSHCGANRGDRAARWRDGVRKVENGGRDVKRSLFHGCHCGGGWKKKRKEKKRKKKRKPKKKPKKRKPKKEKKKKRSCPSDHSIRRSMSKQLAEDLALVAGPVSSEPDDLDKRPFMSDGMMPPYSEHAMLPKMAINQMQGYPMVGGRVHGHRTRGACDGDVGEKVCGVDVGEKVCGVYVGGKVVGMM